jgi:two-component system nitrate/nitrite response regulator NarL
MKKSPAMRGPLRVFIADSSSMGCQLMVRALQQSRQPIKVAGSATESVEIIKGLVTNRSDVAIISADLRNGPITGFRVIREARLSCPHIRMIVLADSPDRALVVEGFRAGADGVFFRDEPFEMLCKCIRAVCEGQIWASSEQLRYVIEALAKDEPQPIKSANGTQLLTKREEELVQLVAEALTNRDIARQLNLTEHTVRNYLFRIFNKLGTSNRLELALYVIKQRAASQGSDSGGTWLAEPVRGLGAGRAARDTGSVAVSSND